MQMGVFYIASRFMLRKPELRACNRGKTHIRSCCYEHLLKCYNEGPFPERKFS